MPAGGEHPGAHRVALAAMIVADERRRRMLVVKRRDHLRGVIAAAIVDDDHLAAIGLAREIVRHALQRLRQAAFFVKSRNDDGEKRMVANNGAMLQKRFRNTGLFYLKKGKTQPLFGDPHLRQLNVCPAGLAARRLQFDQSFRLDADQTN